MEISIADIASLWIVVAFFGLVLLDESRDRRKRKAEREEAVETLAAYLALSQQPSPEEGAPRSDQRHGALRCDGQADAKQPSPADVVR